MARLRYSHGQPVHRGEYTVASACKYRLKTLSLFQIANVAALMVNVATIALYFVYPPLTWRVPIIGTGPQQKKKE